MSFCFRGTAVFIPALVLFLAPWLAAQPPGGTTGAIQFGPDGPLQFSRVWYSGESPSAPPAASRAGAVSFDPREVFALAHERWPNSGEAIHAYLSVWLDLSIGSRP